MEASRAGVGAVVAIVFGGGWRNVVGHSGRQRGGIAVAAVAVGRVERWVTTASVEGWRAGGGLLQRVSFGGTAKEKPRWNRWGVKVVQRRGWAGGGDCVSARRQGKNRGCKEISHTLGYFDEGGFSFRICLWD